MPRRKSNRSNQPLREINQSLNVLQSTRIAHDVRSVQSKVSEPQTPSYESQLDDVGKIKSLFEDDDNLKPSTSSARNALATNTEALYSELDSFRQRWKRELEGNEQPELKPAREVPPSASNDNQGTSEEKQLLEDKEKPECTNASTLKDSFHVLKTDSTADEKYSEAKKLFLIAVELEQDGMHHESIRYYKQSMHLCPDVEKQIFREQCEASARASAIAEDQVPTETQSKINELSNDGVERQDLLDKIRQNYCDDDMNDGYIHCRPSTKPKQGTLHMSDLPHELIMQVFRYVIGQDLDLASLESLGLVCRGFYILSKDSSLWRSICCNTWKETSTFGVENSENYLSWRRHVELDWRRMFIERPRVNYDGVYISRTRYIRQGDVGFQDITYRPFHVIRYYRYLRFFPDKRVLILTTNEEPDKIIPIFRHALHSKQFSSELSILEGTYELCGTSHINIVAEKDCRTLLSQSLYQSQRRQAQFHWSRQTPLSQKFNLKFELKTAENKPYRNNVLKWVDYTISTKLETKQEITTFDLMADTFPNLLFSRVKRFNLRLTKPLSSH